MNGNAKPLRPTDQAQRIVELVSRSARTLYYIRAYEDPRNDPGKVRDHYEEWLLAKVERILEG